MQSDLLKYIISTSLTQNEILERIRLIQGSLQKKMFGGDSGTVSDLPSSLENQEWLNRLDPHLLEGITRNNIDTVFTGLTETVKKTAPLIIFLPFEIPRPELIQLITYLRQSYGPAFLAEVKFDPNLIAGASFVWKGVYKDYSIHQRIDDNRSEIITMFQKYIK